ncbi:DEAD/DEAH box helicase [Polycladidibacter stylochi]|uniref:DEAD/DEAH box helicase n=1 Tax=Polycladidibacter stylochi TaxID=1807766 RepID=UPI00082F28E8|nr:DEAD/DEAH box helicase [Pseudovibrio stylochi]
MSFATLGLSEKVLAAVEASGYTEPTAIQAEAIPSVMERRDVLGIAQTGTGKTASFTLPMISLLEKGRARARMPRTLILEPTRELAAQVAENFDRYGVNHKLNVALLIGGVSFADQDRILERGADVLIATPGRLLDHVERGKLLMQGVEILVIDEADRMLDMGFIPDIERISKLIPFTRQTMLFSATMPSEIQKLADQFLQNPVRVEVAKASSTAETVTQKLVPASFEDYEKRSVLRDQIKAASDLQNAIVFCNRKRDVATVFRSLIRHEFSVGALHGDMDQRSRMTMLDNFKKGNISILIASDVAARGLDIPSVSHVFNYDLPTNPEDYVHRIGRTGRAGRDGTAISIVTGDDEKLLKAIEETIQATIDWDGEPIDFAAAQEEKKQRRKSRTRTNRSSTDKKSASQQPAEAKQPKAAPPIYPGDEQPVIHDEAFSHNRYSHKRPAPSTRHSKTRQAAPEEELFKNASHIPAFLLREARPRAT